MKVRLLGGREGRSTNVSPENCINWYYEQGENGESLVFSPGATQFADLGTGEVRGGIEYNGLAYFVMGNTLYEINSAGTSTSRGTLNTSTGRVSMAHNGVRAGSNQQIMIVDGTTGYIYDNTTSTLTEIADTDMVAADTVTFLDGYFVFSQNNSDRFWITGLYDGTAIDENDFSTAEGDPDKLQAVIADKRDLLLFGKKTLEVWYNTGDPDNTFQRYQGGSVQMGCAAKHSVARFDNTVAWLTENERGHLMVAVLGQAYTPQYISTPEVNYRLSKYTTFSNAFAYVYQHEGHEFYCLTFPNHNVTEVYDAATKRWHRRSHTINGVFPHRERYNCHVFAFGKHLFGDYQNGKIYEMDTSISTFDGGRVERQLVLPNITDDERRIRISEFHLDMEEGTGDPNDSTDTTIWLSYSKDGGHHYGDEIDASIGDAGEYRLRAIWRRLGWGRNWTFKIRTWTPNKVILKAAYIRFYGER